MSIVACHPVAVCARAEDVPLIRGARPPVAGASVRKGRTPAPTVGRSGPLRAMGDELVVRASLGNSSVLASLPGGEPELLRRWQTVPRHTFTVVGPVLRPELGAGKRERRENGGFH